MEKQYRIRPETYLRDGFEQYRSQVAVHVVDETIYYPPFVLIQFNDGRQMSFDESQVEEVRA